MPVAKDIFLDALDLPDDQRPAFVAAQCQGDAALLARVGELLAAEEKARFIDKATAALGTSWAAGSPTRTGLRVKVEQPGDAIGRYVLIRQLGEGGFGAVFLAGQTEPVTRNVALKILKLGMNSEQIIKRFEGERQTLALMDHPNIARVFDAGATEAGRPYFVMEYVDGPPVTEYATAKNLSIRQRLELMEQVCIAVQHAHQRGIIHRDLKPGNILVAEVDGKPEPKVIDFGIAKAASPDNALLPALTLEAQVIGTPQYMSPEQASGGLVGGATVLVDTRSDVYSLGTVLYELMTGLPPFNPVLLRNAGLDKICQIIREQTPSKPSTRLIDSRLAPQEKPPATQALSTEVRHIAGEVDWIVMKALEKEPARRYQSAADLAADIRRHLENRAVLAGPPSRFYQVRKFASRHRPTIAAAGLVVAALLGATAVSVVSANHARRAEKSAVDERALAQANEQRAVENEKRAVENEQRATQNEYRANEELAKALSIAAFSRDLITGIGPSVAKGRDTTLLRELLKNSIKFADKELGKTPMPNLMVRAMIAEAFSALGDQKKALEQLEPAWNAVPERLWKERDLSEISVLLGSIYVEDASSAKAEPIFARVIAAHEANGGPNHFQAQSARLAIAQILAKRGQYDKAEPVLRSAIAGFKASGELSSPLATHTINSLATMLAQDGRNDEAIKLWRDLAEAQRQRDGPDSTVALMTLNNLAAALGEIGYRDEAVKTYKEVIAHQQRLYPPNHPDVLKTMNNYGALLTLMGRLDEAEEVLKAPYQAWRPGLATSESLSMAVQVQMLQLRRAQKRYDEAITLTQELIDAYARYFTPDAPHTLAIYPMLFACYADAGRAAEGITLVKKMETEGLADKMAAPQRASFEAAAGLLFLKAGDKAEAQRRVGSALQA